MLITNLLLFLSQKKIIFYFFFGPYSTKSELWCDAIIIINYWVVKKGGVAVVLVVVVNGWLNFTPILMNWLGLLDNGCCFSQILKRSKSRLTQSFTHTALLQIYLITPSLSLSLCRPKNLVDKCILSLLAEPLFSAPILDRIIFWSRHHLQQQQQQQQQQQPCNVDFS